MNKTFETKKSYEIAIFKINISVDTNKANKACLYQLDRLPKNELRIRLFLSFAKLKLQVIFFRFSIYLFSLPPIADNVTFLTKREYNL